MMADWKFVIANYPYKDDEDFRPTFTEFSRLSVWAREDMIDMARKVQYHKSVVVETGFVKPTM